ncbi:adenylate kinase [Corynebacterium lizhenjunii]|nr:adenylate kinase [Corynebacterium lizhenjunii]
MGTAACPPPRIIDYDEDILWEPAARAPWTLRTKEQQRARASELIAAPHWVMASMGSATRDLIEPQLDVLIYLDYPAHITLTRLLRRTIARALTGATCCNGNRETIRKSFLSTESILVWWCRTFRSRHRSALEREQSCTGPPTLRLRHPRELNHLLKHIRAAQSGTHL